MSGKALAAGLQPITPNQEPMASAISLTYFSNDAKCFPFFDFGQM